MKWTLMAATTHRTELTTSMDSTIFIQLTSLTLQQVPTQVSLPSSNTRAFWESHMIWTRWLCLQWCQACRIQWTRVSLLNKDKLLKWLFQIQIGNRWVNQATCRLYHSKSHLNPFTRHILSRMTMMILSLWNDHSWIKELSKSKHKILH